MVNGDGLNGDGDVDGDGVCDDSDACPLDADDEIRTLIVPEIAGEKVIVEVVPPSAAATSE